ncbi:hypothetical protein ABL78_1129 [Leptomonas seymouri]|uniref:Uncharacterized protein n=1 Tax=Leptomonas seymouri TaxID=5684 RepID=A0A0N0P8B1_LEPSE|nr:hypothetical protein ABL78_1129 [Leptomonas seymouri]|eukprot:KPI89749.1 hypothetical protein ABL78_1129 [Leptomonas seymouri]
MFAATPKESPPAQTKNSTGNTKLPADYQCRLDDCEKILARHHFVRDGLQRSLNWTKVNIGFDTTLVVLGGYFGWQNYITANQEASFLRSVTGNPHIRRIFTPFTLFSLMGVLLGIFSFPVDVAALSTVQNQIQMQDQAIQNGEATRESIIREGTSAAASIKEVLFT